MRHKLMTMILISTRISSSYYLKTVTIKSRGRRIQSFFGQLYRVFFFFAHLLCLYDVFFCALQKLLVFS